MKPKEFDELIRRKFDQNDFAYNAGNWDRLAEKMDGRGKKRNMLVWWWVPLAGMAASVALAFGISTVLRMGTPATMQGSTAHTERVNGHRTAHPAVNGLVSQPQLAQNGEQAPVNDIYSNAEASNRHRHYTRTPNAAATNNNRHKLAKGGEEEDFSINIDNATSKIVFHAKPVDLPKNMNDAEPKKNTNTNKKVAVNEAIGTFAPQEEPVVPKTPRLSIILSGGYSHGSQNTGYAAGATIRKMINDKVYVESDVALASSSNTQSTAYVEKQISQSPQIKTGKVLATGKVTSGDANKSASTSTVSEVIRQRDISYDLYYAQVTPSVGYKLMKRMSVGIGPDFQRMLVDNRPAPSSVDRNTVQVAPLFDVGFIGKSEYALTKKVKAAVYYRKGVNNVITPEGKYIDRDYLQFQVKYTIFNK